MKIGIIGSGSFGTALAKVFSKKNQVYIYSIDYEAIKNISLKNHNNKYLPNVKLSKKINASTDIEIIKKTDLIFLCVPSSAYENVLKKLSSIYFNQIIISGSKGLNKLGEPLTEIIYKNIKCKKENVFAISGPSIAKEIGENKFTSVILGGDKKNAEKIIKDLETSKFNLKISHDINGIQYLGFFKNILALLAGVCDGLKLGNNFKSALISKAYSDFYYINKDKKISKHSFIDFAGLGDLYVTSISDHSRNRLFGYYLGKNKSIDLIKNKIGNVIESYDNINNIKDKIIVELIGKNLFLTLKKILKEKNKKIILENYLKA